MAARTNLLTLVQQIMRRMNSDSISVLGETEEADQVQEIVESTFYDLMEQREWGHKKELIRLTASGDSTQPTRMQIPETVMRVLSFRYDKRLLATDDALFQEVDYKAPNDFMNSVLTRVPSSNIIEINDNVQQFDYYVYNDRAPRIWTSFDDEYLWFDAYDASLETTLQASKSLAYVVQSPSFPTAAEGIPDVPEPDWQLFKNACIAACFATIKQAQDGTSSNFVRRHMIRTQKRNSQKVGDSRRGVDFGR